MKMCGNLRKNKLCRDIKTRINMKPRGTKVGKNDKLTIVAKEEKEVEAFDFMSPRLISRNLMPNHEIVSKLSKDGQTRNENEEMGKVTAILPKVNSVLRDITNSRFAEEVDKSKCKCSSWKNQVARERWKMLAKALLEPEKNSGKATDVKDISVRRFATFDLITPNKLEKLENWFTYTARYFQNLYLEIHHLEPKLTPKKLIGFNNTGNICIWPSEEVLTHYLLSKIHLFQGKEILELGGGMACLAGVTLAKYGNVKRLDLTDGNAVSVENVSKIVARNNLNPNVVAAFQLDWVDHRKLTKTYDVILSSDCLFFDDTREDLVETIWRCLREDGVALVMAPRRGTTLDAFAKLAAARGFGAVIQTFYEEIVWKHHLRFLKYSPEYNEDLHYPILLLLTKSKTAFPVNFFCLL